ncbi:MAG: helix-turn-helix domain-containing protein [Bacteroidaceae bacterium]|nr:helix-turn-helix domain-containing protein [Bacteroidaceae bacterium]
MAEIFRTATFTISNGQMASLLDLLAPVMDVFVEKVAQRVRELQEAAKPRYYSRKEVADLLHVSLPTVHAMANAGAITPKKVGGRVLFEAQIVDEAIKNGDLRKSTWNKKGGLR